MTDIPPGGGMILVAVAVGTIFLGLDANLRHLMRHDPKNPLLLGLQREVQRTGGDWGLE